MAMATRSLLPALLLLACLSGISAKTTLNPVGIYGNIATAQRCLGEIWTSARARLTTTSIPNCLRYAFHDAGTYDTDTDSGGANGSITKGELSQGANAGLDECAGIIGQVTGDVRSKPGCGSTTVADVIQVVGAVAVSLAGGPSCPMLMGRPDKDGQDNVNLASPCNKIDGLLARFTRNGFNDPVASLVVLLGSHSIGRSRASPAGTCSRGLGGLTTNNAVFDNHFYQGISTAPANPNDPLGNAWLFSDNQLFNGGNQACKDRVTLYANSLAAFRADWCPHYQEMSLLGVSVDGSFLPISTAWLPPSPGGGGSTPSPSPPPPVENSPPPLQNSPPPTNTQYPPPFFSDFFNAPQAAGLVPVTVGLMACLIN